MILRTLPSRARAFLLLALSLPSCTKNDTPAGPLLVIPPSVEFTPGAWIAYERENFDWNGNRTAAFEHMTEVVATGEHIAGLDGVAAVRVTTGPPGGGTPSGIDTVFLAYAGSKLLIYDPGASAGGGYPALTPWSVLLDLRLQAAPDTILAFDSTFSLTMASGHLLRDRVACIVATRYEGIAQLPAFGSPIVNCFVFTRTTLCTETVDTAGVLLFQGETAALTDSLWYADDIGPIRMSSRGNTLGIDSLGLPFSLAALRVVHGPDTHRSLEVRYSRAGGVDELSLRYGPYEFPAPVTSVTMAYARSY